MIDAVGFERPHHDTQEFTPPSGLKPMPLFRSLLKVGQQDGRCIGIACLLRLHDSRKHINARISHEGDPFHALLLLTALGDCSPGQQCEE